MPDDITASTAGQTIPQLFLNTVRGGQDGTALRWENEDGTWGEWTWGDYHDQVASAAEWMKSLGVTAGDRVVLMMRNIPEFHVLDLAACFIGATPISIYNSSSPEQIAYLVRDSEAVAAFVENDDFRDKFNQAGDMPTLRTIEVVRTAPGVRDLLSATSADLDALAEQVSPETLATVIYTSGTTGPPKGVSLTHANVCWTIESLARILAQSTRLEDNRVVSYLPMAHIAERMSSHYMGLRFHYEVTCCPTFAELSKYLAHVHPTMFFGVPRVWEKINATLVGLLAADPANQQKFNEAIEQSIPLVEAVTMGAATDDQRADLASFDEDMFRPLREMIGLDACRLAITGAAPIPVSVVNWFRAVGVPLTEVYGLSETTGLVTYEAARPKPGAVGKPIPGCEVKLGQDGEVICRGGNMFNGYLNLPKQTADVLDADGWFHTGDIGTFDEDGYLRIVDRKKELIITAGGKNISPANLEAALKTIPLVGQACAIGDGRPFVSALVTLDPDVAPGWAAHHDIAFEGMNELAQHPDVIAAINTALTEAMDGFNHAEAVKRVKVIGDDWQPDSDVLTPTAKLKRRGIHTRYATEIEGLYS